VKLLGGKEGESKYELYSRTGNIDKLLSGLPEYKE